MKAFMAARCSLVNSCVVAIVAVFNVIVRDIVASRLHNNRS